MDADSIFNIIIILIVLGSVISRIRKHSSQQSDKPKKTPAWKQILQDIVSEIGREFDTEKAEPGSKDWEYIISQDRDIAPGYGKKTQVPPPLPVADEREKDKLPDEKKTEPQIIPQHPAHTKKFLQKAVVWSEILGPPVGLRK
ncbi:MAG: hypothetical protein GY749_10510 [Desulfobacteraceae bacterium]|nr:hypothetical protein [Desulfobacteraceae bacterium]